MLPIPYIATLERSSMKQEILTRDLSAIQYHAKEKLKV